MIPEDLASGRIQRRDRPRRGAALVAGVARHRDLERGDRDKETAIVEGWRAGAVCRRVPADPMLPQQRPALEVHGVGVGAGVHEPRGGTALGPLADHNRAADHRVGLVTPAHATGGQVERQHLAKGSSHQRGVSRHGGRGTHVGSVREGEGPPQFQLRHAGGVQSGALGGLVAGACEVPCEARPGDSARIHAVPRGGVRAEGGLRDRLGNVAPPGQVLGNLNALLRGHAGALHAHDPVLEHGDDGAWGKLLEESGPQNTLGSRGRVTGGAPLREELFTFLGGGRGACDETGGGHEGRRDEKAARGHGADSRRMWIVGARVPGNDKPPEALDATQNLRGLLKPAATRREDRLRLERSDRVSA